MKPPEPANQDPTNNLPPLSRNQWLLMNLSTKTGTDKQWWEENEPEKVQESLDLIEALELAEYDVPATQAKAKELVAQWLKEGNPPEE